MGARAADKLKEIEQLRSSLAGKLDEIERRIPLAGYGRKIAAGLAGSSVAASALGIGLRRVRGSRKKKKRSVKSEPSAAPAVVTVNVLPKGAAWLAAAGLVGWAGIKVYETLQRAKRDESARPTGGRPAVVTQMPEPGRQTGL